MEKIFYEMDGKKHFKASFVVLIEQAKCDEVESTIKDTPAIDLVDSTGTNILHLSAQYDNVNMIKLCINHGCLNSENCSGITPFDVAVMRKNFEVAETLMWKTGSSEDSILLSDVILVRNVSFTKMFLTKRISTYDVDFKSSLFLAVSCLDLKNTKVLFDHGLRSGIIRSSYFVYFMSLLADVSKENSIFCQKIINWEVLGTEYEHMVFRMLKYSRIEVLQLFFESDYYSEMKQRHKIDLMANVCMNRSNNVVNFLEMKKIDVNARSFGGNTPLHYAVVNSNGIIVRYLLEKGANSNALNDANKTPLFVSTCADCTDLLLEHGANYTEPVGPKNESFAVYVIRKVIRKEDIFYNNVINTVAGLEFYPHSLSVPITLVQIPPYFAGVIRRFYNHCLRQLFKLKSHVIRELKKCESEKVVIQGINKLTMFTILSERPEKIANLVKPHDREIIKKYIMQYRNGNTLLLYYRNILLDRLLRFKMLCYCKEQAISIISENIYALKTHELVVEKIVSYLTNEDLCMFI